MKLANRNWQNAKFELAKCLLATGGLPNQRVQAARVEVSGCRFALLVSSKRLFFCFCPLQCRLSRATLATVLTSLVFFCSKLFSETKNSVESSPTQRRIRKPFSKQENSCQVEIACGRRRRKKPRRKAIPRRTQTVFAPSFVHLPQMNCHWKVFWDCHV